MIRSRTLSLSSVALLGLSALFLPSSGQAQTERPTPLPALGRSLVGNGDSTSIIQNPANLAFLPGTELRWTGNFLEDRALAPTQGHAFAFAFPLGFLPITTGLRLDLVSPGTAAQRATFGSPYSYQWLTWALAWGGESISFGASLERSYSNTPEAHGLGSWSVGTSMRPWDYLGLAAVVRNANAPRSESGFQLGATYEFGVAVRPTGSDALEVGLEAQYIDQAGGYWVPRATADVGIPGLGRLRGDVSWYDPQENLGASSWIASTSLVLTGNYRRSSAELSVGTRYGSGLGSAASGRVHENLHTEIALRGFRESSAIDNLSYGLRVVLEKTPSPREHVRLLRRLWQMADEEKGLQAVLLEIRTAPAGSFAHIQELQDALYHLRSRGKKVLCHLEDGSAAAIYLCSAADRILLSPAGTVRYSGLKSHSYHVKGLLDHLGIRADFVRVGKNKSAPEMFDRTESSEAARAARTELLQQVELEMSNAIASGRKLSIEELRETVARGPFTAAEAKQARLVDGLAFRDMLESKVDELAGQPLVLEEGSYGPQRADRFGPRQRLAIVYVEGDMVDGRSQSFPFLGIKTAGSATIVEALRQVRNDPSVGAVVLRIETGGGSALAADVIWREVQLTTAKKPVIVSMGAAAASGGYYIASPSTHIYANPLTLTGSIGVFFGKIDVAGLLNKVGVNVDTLRTTPHADAAGPFRPFTEEERHLLQRKIDQTYALFLERVASGRKLKKEQVDAAGQGRVWTGRQAKQHQLVDSLGGLRQAMAHARVLGELREDAPVLELPVLPTSLLGYLLGMEGVKAGLGVETPPLPAEMMSLVRSVAPYAVLPTDSPLTRVEELPPLLP